MLNQNAEVPGTSFSEDKFSVELVETSSKEVEC
jgi:hypothetical protein